MDSNANKKIAGALVIGGLVGAGLALLFAPQSGKKTRKDISRFTRNVVDEAKDMIEDATESVKELTDRISDRISDLSSSRRELADDAKKKIAKTLENVQRSIEKQKEKFI